MTDSQAWIQSPMIRASFQKLKLLLPGLPLFHLSSGLTPHQQLVHLFLEVKELLLFIILLLSVSTCVWDSFFSRISDFCLIIIRTKCRDGGSATRYDFYHKMRTFPAQISSLLMNSLLGSYETAGFFCGIITTMVVHFGRDYCIAIDPTNSLLSKKQHGIPSESPTFTAVFFSFALLHPFG